MALKKLTETKEAMDKVLAIEFAVRKLALLICSPNVNTRRYVLQILSTACLHFEAKPPGHRQVTDALEHYRATRGEKGRFETIVQSLKQFDDEPYLITVIKVVLVCFCLED